MIDKDEKIITLLRFSIRSASVVTGHDAVIRQIEKKKVSLIILAKDLSLNTKKNIDIYAKRYNIDLINWGSKNLYQQIFGKMTGIIGILDINFKKGLMEHFSLNKMED